VWLTTEVDDQSSLHYAIVSTDFFVWCERRSCLQTWATTTFDTSEHCVISHRTAAMRPRATITVAACLLCCAVVVVSRPGRRRHSSSRSTMSSRAVRHQTRHGCSVTRPPRRRRFVARSSTVLYNSRAVKRTFLRFRF